MEPTTRQTGTSKQPESEFACASCGGTKSGRNLVVAFDGTSNQFGDYNTNVVELYSRIIKDNDTQLAYYNSGIGTYARPGWRSLAYLRQVILHKFDLAIAWNFERIILKGYRWLSDHYKPGDKIFLFGFSRGAYQARVLAGMIATVGLICPGNDEQIPFAYELYADLKHHKATTRPSKDEEDSNFRSMTDRFKQTFSIQGVKVHFVGVWDTVSSVGIIRGKDLPFTNENGHICYVRHALALDERRVKFLPEYVWGGASSDTSTSHKRLQRNTHRCPRENNGAGREGDVQPYKMFEETESSVNDSRTPPLKEVWFSGTHSDIGGGNVPNKDLNNAAQPVIWMGNEALMAGLILAPSKAEWSLGPLKIDEPNHSIHGFYQFMELLPFKRLTYADPNETCWWPHMAQGRVIKSGQKIHASVAFAKNYSTKAKFEKGMKEDMRDIVGKGNKEDKYNREWMVAIGDILEKDLFDHSAAGEILARFKDGEVSTDLSHRLSFIASSREGSRAIIAADNNLEVVLGMLKDRAPADGCDILASLAKNGLVPQHISENNAVFSAVSTLIDGDIVDESISASRLLRHFASHFGLSMRVDRSIIMCLSRMLMKQDTKARTNACKALFNLSDRVNSWSVKPIEEEIAGFLDTQDATEKIAGAWIIAKFSTIAENSLRSDPNIFSKLVQMFQDESAAISSSGAYALSACVQYGVQLTVLNTKAVAGRIHDILDYHDAQLQRAGAELLTTLVTRGAFGMIISEKNIFPCIVRMLEGGDRDELKADHKDEIQTALGLFEKLSTNEECRNLMINNGVVTEVIHLFHGDPKGASPIGATAVLENFTQHRVLRDAMIHAGIMETLNDMLRTISIDKQDRALRVLKRLTVHEDFRNSAMNREIIQGLVVKLKKKAHPSITTTALDILEELSHDEKFWDDLRRKKVASHVVGVFKKGRSNVKIHAASFLQAISDSKALQADVVLKDVFPTLTEMLRNGHENERLAAIDLLTALEFFKDECVNALVESGSAFPAIMRMFDTGSTLERMCAAELLKTFAQYRDFRTVAVGMDVIHISVAKLNTHTPADRSSALKVLRAYFAHEEAREQLRREKVIPKLVEILKEDTCTTRFEVTGFLGELVLIRDFKSRIPAEIIPNLTNQLETAQEPEDRALVRNALKAFAKYDDFRKMIPTQVLESLGTEANGKVIR